MLSKLIALLHRPDLNALETNNSCHSLWDDEHISKGMLEAHLNPDWDAATRSHAFVDQSVHWIAKFAPPPQYPKLLDLGCGPGLYAERFTKAGYAVTGLDFSRRSIAYAREQAVKNGSGIAYHVQNYLTMDYAEQFDVITLIMGDYAVLSAGDRIALLKKTHRALRSGAKFIFDVFTPKMRREESRSWQVCRNGGFFSEKPHLLLDAIYQYDDEDRTELRQSIVITEDDVKRYNVYDHFFTKEALSAEVQPIGFSSAEFYGDVAGKEYSDTGETICVVLTK